MSEEIGIRQARPADAAALGQLRVITWQEAYPGILPDSLLSDMSTVRQHARFAEMIESRSEDHAVFCAEDALEDGSATMVAYGICGPARAGPKGYTGEIHELYVLSDHYGRGIGWAMMATMSGWLAAKGHKALFAAVLQQNHGARAFYTRIGGERCGEGRIVMGGAPLVQEAFGWRDLPRLMGREAGSRLQPIARRPEEDE